MLGQDMWEAVQECWHDSSEARPALESILRQMEELRAALKNVRLLELGSGDPVAARE